MDTNAARQSLQLLRGAFQSYLSDERESNNSLDGQVKAKFSLLSRAKEKVVAAIFERLIVHSGNISSSSKFALHFTTSFDHHDRNKTEHQEDVAQVRLQFHLSLFLVLLYVTRRYHEPRLHDPYEGRPFLLYLLLLFAETKEFY